MITKLTIAAAAALLSTAAYAQTPAPMTSPDTGAMQSAPSGTMTPPMASPDTTMSAPAPADQMASSHGITMVDGKYMMGDRPATKAEIKAHKAMMKKKG